MHLPPPLSMASVNGDGQISGNASEKWCLLRILPFLLNGACTGVVWETYEYLRHVTDIVLAKQVPQSAIGFWLCAYQTFFRLLHVLFHIFV